MTFDFEIGGRARRVTVEPLTTVHPSGGRFRITVDDVVHVIDARRTDLGWSIVHDTNRRSVDAAVTEERGGDVLVQLPHVDVPVAVDGRRYRADATDAAHSSRDGRISAPMPGRVVRVLVSPGDAVAARQGLVIVEAMKMENELTASAAGRVAEVLVVEGQSVEAGRLLVRLEN
jgi:biotin carboxyl carrier protein